MTIFELDHRLAGDSVPITDLALSTVRLMNERSWPWLILVPRHPGLVEIVDLEPADRGTLMEEITSAANALRRLYRPDKLNVAALGNQVSQLHVHVIARFKSDPAWPRPIWGVKPAMEPYEANRLSQAVRRIAAALQA
ncbi:MAG TPA: HIT family protein [Alphaproteobacteria bacterium]|nr:HIT family protein [Alphaproteobacteria bacterium]